MLRVDQDMDCQIGEQPDNVFPLGGPPNRPPLGQIGLKFVGISCWHQNQLAVVLLLGASPLPLILVNWQSCGMASMQKCFTLSPTDHKATLAA